jgi:hypothetical protein
MTTQAKTEYAFLFPIESYDGDYRNRYGTDTSVSFSIRLVQIEQGKVRNLGVDDPRDDLVIRVHVSREYDAEQTPHASCHLRWADISSMDFAEVHRLSKLAKTLERRLDALNNAIGFAKGGEAEFLRFCKALGVTRCAQYTRHSGSSSYDDSEFQFSDHQGGARWLRKMTERIGESLPKRDAA